VSEELGIKSDFEGLSGVGKPGQEKKCPNKGALGAIAKFD
jgi:hypothetical protein